MSLILVSVLAPIGALFCLLAVAASIRGYTSFVVFMLITLYRIAMGEVAAIDVAHGDGDDDEDD